MTSLSRITWPRASFVGFDNIWNELDQFITQGVDQSPAFPRHNVVKFSEEHYQIQVALAGYAREDLTIEMKNKSLVVSGEKKDEDVNYIHKGISAKKFSKEFRLNENMRVDGARYVDGVLMVELIVVMPEESKPRTIDIQ